MLWHVARRVLGTIPVLWGLVTVTFLMLAILPGDAATILLGYRYTAAAGNVLRHQLGLDQPLWEQYVHYWEHLFHGQLGHSMTTQQLVTHAVGSQYLSTVELALAGMAIAVLLGGAAGIVAAMRFRSWFDFGAIVVATLGLSVPNFFFGILLILLVGVKLGWVPVVGATGFGGLVLPALAISLPVAGYIARIVRSSMLEVLGADYLTTARAKGLNESVVVLRHALRNALIPIITVIGLLFGQLLGGAIIVENVFARPGLGRLLVVAIQQRDIPVVQGGVLVVGLTYVLVNLLVDISYTVVDPRIRFGKAA
jgi:ABC-type dipeptide/oligopeptide/nickel transport system permease component